MLTGRSSVTRLIVGVLGLGLSLLVLRAQDDTDPRKPAWAYAVSPGAPIAAARGPQPRAAGTAGGGANGQPGARRGGGGPPDPTLYSVPGSKFQFTMAQIRSTTEPIGNGIGTIPGLANRGPSYLARQLYDFQTGARNGSLAPLMKAVAVNLTSEDMVNILAYVSSRKP